MKLAPLLFAVLGKLKRCRDPFEVFRGGRAIAAALAKTFGMELKVPTVATLRGAPASLADSQRVWWRPSEPAVAAES